MRPHPHPPGFWQKRLPFLNPFLSHMRNFPMPPVNAFWALGGCMIATLCLMVASGIFLALHYTPDITMAFSSVEAIERRIPSGWFLRALHRGGATMIFAALYLHMGRGLWYGSYKAPRELVWFSGMLVFILFMITAFAGYVLPWGQMSYWGANVVTHALTALPGIGPDLTQWLMGGSHLGNAALHRFFILHLVLGFCLVALIGLHVLCLHGVGSSNPTIDSPHPITETKPFIPFYSSKDSVIFCFFLLLYAVLIFFLPEWLEKTANLHPANPLKTPANITPEWYLAPFYAMLRAVPSRLGGIMLCTLSLLGLLLLPWLDRGPRHNARYRPVIREGWIMFFCAFISLIAAGLHETTPFWLWLSRGAMGVYFAMLFILLPLASIKEHKQSRTGIKSDIILGLVLLLLSPMVAQAQTPPLAAQHGLKIYQQICSACHGIKQAHYSDFAPLSPNLTLLEDWARQRQGSEQADLSSPVASPYPNAKIAKAANGGDFPPDLSHIARTIKGGPDYIETMLQDYHPVPSGMILGPHDYYNPVALTHHKHFHMPPPLKEGAVIYANNVKPSEAQMAHDVTVFLQWVDDQHQTSRNFWGLVVLAYLLMMTGLVWVWKRQIWKE